MRTLLGAVNDIPVYQTNKYGYYLKMKRTLLLHCQQFKQVSMSKVNKPYSAYNLPNPLDIYPGLNFNVYGRNCTKICGNVIFPEETINQMQSHFELWVEMNI